jgi:uncharacterized protein YbcC (UPF0753/DUF2309 family)
MGKKLAKELVKVLDSKQISIQQKKERVPDAQMVFCIDTRSELIRRHVENKGIMKLLICRFFELRWIMKI